MITPKFSLTGTAFSEILYLLFQLQEHCSNERRISEIGIDADDRHVAVDGCEFAISDPASHSTQRALPCRIDQHVSVNKKLLVAFWDRRRPSCLRQINSTVTHTLLIDYA
ncbi:hypothetical protein H483_0103730 [Dietzia sp. UCD-THP]|nr:hypothetical protein H483_0103730 [Dietzia sp. UCD-THP]